MEVNRAEATARLNYLRETCTTELNQTLEEIAIEGKILCPGGGREQQQDNKGNATAHVNSGWMIEWVW